MSDIKRNTDTNSPKVIVTSKKKSLAFLFIFFLTLSGILFTLFSNRIVSENQNQLIPGDYPDTIDRTLPVALEQLKLFPKPDYANRHIFQPNFLWMDPTYLSGYMQKGTPTKSAINNSVEIQELLAAYYHYSLIVNANTKLFNKYNDPFSFQYAWVNLANRHPEWKAGTISFWSQTRPRHLNDSNCTGDRPLILRKDLSEDYYINYSTASAPKARRWNPAQPAEAYRCDWQTQRFYFDTLLKALKRPLHFISENAEVFPLLSNDEIKNNERCKLIMQQAGIYDPYLFQSKQRFAIESKYREAITTLPGLEKVNYSVYSIDGFSKYRHHWTTMRMIQSEQHGMRYATPDFYPRWPKNWRKWDGAWHGLQWVLDARKEEIKTGDHCFSPFIAAGWDKDETKNIRPGPWLGLLKLMHALGAEYFYTGYFTETKIPNKPEQYIWQAVMPAYAQAALSHTGDFVFNSETLFPENDFLIETGDKDVMFIARKHKTLPLLLWCITLGRNSNNAGENHYKQVQFNWKGKTYTCTARVQGSMFYVNEGSKEPTIIQLDRWHEDTHPLRWAKEHYSDAALWSLADTSLKLKQSNPNAELIEQLLYTVTLTGGNEVPLNQQLIKGTKRVALTLIVNELSRDALLDVLYEGNIIQTLSLKKGSNRVEFPLSIQDYSNKQLSIRIKKGNIDITQWMLEQK